MDVRKGERKAQKFHQYKPLVLVKKGIAPFMRHFVKEDFSQAIPRAEFDRKFTGESYVQVNDIADEKNCDSIILFETKHSEEHYMWLSLAHRGPTVCFYVENIHTIEELHLIGECSNKTRPLLFFDPKFDESPLYGISKELLKRAYGVPAKSSQKFVDTAITFSIADGHIWFSRYQIMWDEGELRIYEAGPRFCLRIILALSGSFCGTQIYKDEGFVPPHKLKKLERKKSQQ